mgnify:FL=1
MKRFKQSSTKYSIVPQYESDGDDYETNADQTIGKVSKKRRKQRKKMWIFDRKFTSKIEAMEFIKSQKIWGYHYTNDTKDGMKKYYRCKNVPRRHIQCDASIYLHFMTRSFDIHLYKTESIHNCESINAEYGSQKAGSTTNGSK